MLLYALQILPELGKQRWKMTPMLDKIYHVTNTSFKKDHT